MTMLFEIGLIYRILRANSDGLAITALEFDINTGLCINLGYSNIARMIWILLNFLFLNNSFQIFSFVLIKSLGFKADLFIIFSILSKLRLSFKYKTVSKSMPLEFR